MIEHGAAVNTIADVNDTFGVSADDRVLALSALNFDLSVYDVFGLLAAGGAIVLPEPAADREPARWAELAAQHRVTIWNTVPTLMEMLTEHLIEQHDGEPLAIRVVMMSGDWIPITLPERIRAVLPDSAVWSLGGATEASIWSIWYPITEVEPCWTSVPYGKPMRNQQFHVLDKDMRPCPVWVPGDLYIGGAGLARGYFGDEAKTRASFLRHPATGERLYRTGDLGCYLPSGDIEFLGREDFQVKVQGYRIELGEIEAVLLRQPGVRAAVVAALGERQGGKRLVAYVVLGDDQNGGEPVDLAAMLRRDLPEYMVPRHFVILDELPLSSNGKVDRSALPAPDAPVGDEQVQPRNDVERALLEIWIEFFAGQPISISASFFDLGGDSLLAVRLMSRVRAAFHRSLPLSVLFERPTVELLAEVLREAETGSGRSALVPIRETGTAPPLFFVHPVGGDVLCYADLAATLGDDQPFYGLQTPETETVLETVTELAAHYIEQIRTVQPVGPYRLGGWSMGGVVAVEMARLLTEEGAEVDAVLAVDVIEKPGAPQGEPVDDAVLLSWFARDLAGLAGRNLKLTPEELRPLTKDDALALLVDRAHETGVLPDEVGPDSVGAIVHVFMRNFRALLTHQPRPYHGAVRFLRAVDRAAEDTVQAWASVLQGDLRVVDLPGDHYSVVRQPNVAELGAAVRQALEGSESELDALGTAEETPV